jgi:hypothetical protein
MDKTPFQYAPRCSAPSCQQPAVYKVAAPWSDGRKSQELKNYGLACEAHRDSQLARAKVHRQGLRLAEGETVGEVGLYQIETGRRDRELKRLPDH